MLPPRQLVFTALEGALVDPRTDSPAGAEEALSELDRLGIPLILLTGRTRAEIEPLRRKLGHGHPFITENGGGIFVPDGYFNFRIPNGVRSGRYFCIPLGLPYTEVCEALDQIAEECGVGVTGFHHMSPREISENTGLRSRNAGQAREREFEELFYFTTADEKAIAAFVAAARERGLAAHPGPVFWRFSGGGDNARAVRTVAKLFAEAMRAKLRSAGIGGSEEDLPWLRAVDRPVLLPAVETSRSSTHTQNTYGAGEKAGRVAIGEAPGPAGWSSAIWSIIR